MKPILITAGVIIAIYLIAMGIVLSLDWVIAAIDY